MSVSSRPLPHRRAPALAALPTLRRRVLDGQPNATLAGREDVTATLGAFRVELDHPLASFKAGQYVSLGFQVGQDLVQRPYSIVAVDRLGIRIELFIRRLPDGRLSNILWALPNGSRIRVGPAKGLFMLDMLDPRPRILVGTGTGVAPLVAMVGDLAARADRVPTVLLHGASFQDELAFTDRFERWREGGLAIDYRPTVSRPLDARNGGWRGRTGRVGDQLASLLQDAPHLAAQGSVAYLCGNPDMIVACRAILAGSGHVPTDVRVESFHGPVKGAGRAM